MSDRLSELDADYLNRLGPLEAHALFRDILWCTARKLGISLDSFRISLNVDTADGGVDATCRTECPNNDALFRVPTFFQIKTGVNFAPWRKRDLNKELFVGKVSRKQLKSTIRECFEEGRRYVIICLGLDPNEKEFRRGTAILKEELANAGFPNAAVDIWGQAQLIGMLKSFPGLCLRLSGHGNLPICTYEEWRSNEDMCTPLVLSTVQQGLIEEIRKALRSPPRPLIRVIGEPGVGKSRTVLEALREHDLAPAVILVNDSDTFITSSLFHELGRSDVGFHAIVVVDDCSIDHRATIWNKFSSHRDRVQLILNGHEPEDVSGPESRTSRDRYA